MQVSDLVIAVAILVFMFLVASAPGFSGVAAEVPPELVSSTHL